MLQEELMSSEDLPGLHGGDMHLHFPTRLPTLDLEGIYHTGRYVTRDHYL